MSEIVCKISKGNIFSFALRDFVKNGRYFPASRAGDEHSSVKEQNPSLNRKKVRHKDEGKDSCTTCYTERKSETDRERRIKSDNTHE